MAQFGADFDVELGSYKFYEAAYSDIETIISSDLDIMVELTLFLFI